jgi:hypothetical protein
MSHRILRFGFVLCFLPATHARFLTNQSAAALQFRRRRGIVPSLEESMTVIRELTL